MLKNRFVIIIGLSVITLVLLIIGAVTLYEDNSLSFLNDGYILSTTASTDDRYYFSANTKYKKNVDDNVVFSDRESNDVVVDPASFVHYADGSITFLKRGAIVNLNELNNPIISYYNVTNDNLISYDSDRYVITTNNDENVVVNSFVGRINDSKYIIAGSDLSVKIPDQSEEISGSYFEVLFIEEGIVKVYNEEDSFQVTAQGTYFYIGDNIIINLGDNKIYYDGEAKMLLSQITINGDENIDLAVNDDATGGGSGTGDGTGEGGSAGDEDGDLGDEDGTGEGDETTGEEGETGTGNGTGSDEVVDNAMVELVSADVTTTSLNIKLLLNNASSVRGTLKAYITNVSTGNDVAFTIDSKDTNVIELSNGTFDIVTSDTDAVDGTREFHLNPDTEYLLRIVSEDSNNSNQYFQKIFRTEPLGVSLEKMYATESSLKYKINFDENSNVVDVILNIEGDGVSESKKVSVDDNVTEVEFDGLSSNTNYSVYINNVTISEGSGAGVTYASRYNISRIDSTLKKTPSATGKVISVDTDADNARFTINVNNISDPDNSIVGYTYEVYLNDEGKDIVYTVTKNVNSNSGEVGDANVLVLNLSDITQISSGVSYRCRVLVSYNNNEMTREIGFDDGEAFSLNSIPSIEWNSDSFVVGKYDASGTINLIDASCTIPIRGRACSDNNSNYTIKDTTFTLRYYVVGEDETTADEVSFKFDSSDLTYDFDLDMLLSNTNYVMKVYGSYYDDNNVYHENVMIGSSTYFTTAKSDNLSLIINSVNSSNDTDVVNFSMYLDKGTSTEVYEELVTSVSINLYSGAYNNSDKLIGNYVITDRATIVDLFNSLTITNGLFTNLTDFSVGNCSDNKICNREALTNVTNITNNSYKVLNSSYTIEIVSVNVGEDTLVVENPIYTFVLTSSYYLDARIAANPNYNYVIVDEIKKSDLSDEEIESLRDNGISNIDELLDDTVVGLRISNNLSDLFVDSAFSYEKAVVKYIVHSKKNDTDVKVIEVDMGNKYQPGEQTIWLDVTDTKDGFIRGYSYDVGYTIDFTIDSSGLTSDEDRNIVTYDNDVLHKDIDIERQKPVYTQYISSSTASSITYMYSMTDIDNALYDKKAYYSYTIAGENEEDEVVNGESSDRFNTDGEYHSVTLPIEDRVDYSFGYHYKRIDDAGSANNEMDSYTFDSEFEYLDDDAFEIISDVYDNKLKIVLNDNEINDRTVAYRVVLNASGVSEYSMIFLASKLDKYGTYVEEEGSVDTRPYYIAIDYANISRFLGKDITVSLYAYYDTGLVGLNQDFSNGLIIKNIVNNSYLNIYNNGSTDTTSNRVENIAMGVNMVREPLNEDTIYLYNLLMGANNYNNNTGSNYYKNSADISGNIGIKYNLSYSNQGLVINDGSRNYSRYNMKVIDIANLVSDDYSYRFDSITPKIRVRTVNSINGFTIRLTASGIYSDSQFMNNNSSDSNIYIEIYSDEGCTDRIDTKVVSIDITDSNGSYSASIEDASMSDLKPDTTYYFKVFAYINNEYTQLYDEDSSSSSYVYKTYSTKTLNGSEILNRINFSVKPTAYNGEISDKTLTWRLGLNSTDNYKVRFELYKPNGGETIVNESGEEEFIANYEAVNFDGTEAVSCNIDSFGNSDNGYVNGCYISVSRDDVSDINTKDQVYTFNTDDFVFGGNYYRLVVYAIPYTNGEYVEDDKVILYETDSLTSTNGDINSNGTFYRIEIPTLKAPEFQINDFESGYDSDMGYYISFVPTCDDELLSDGSLGSFVIKNGTYTATLIDDRGERIETQSNISAGNANNKVIFDNLSPDKLYSIELSYTTYRNNVGYTESEKVEVTPFIDYIYTPSSELGIRLGTVIPQKVSNSQIQLLYSGSVNLAKNIVQVDYTITLKGGSGSKNTGTYKIDSSNSSIFSVDRDNVVLSIDFSDVDNGHSTNGNFTLVNGGTYIINTQYYYLDNGVLTLFSENTSQLNA